jgi:hypothetical protein
MKKVVIGIVIGVAITLVVIYAPRFIFPAIETPDTNETPETTETYIYIDGKIVVGGDGGPIELIDNPNATDPTYAALLAFLEADQTDKFIYIIGPPKNAYVCADFARDVHNNAESAGIRAAWVGLELEGTTEGHALNAFETTDRGLVFMDCTGLGLWDDPGKWTRWDRRAYVEVGQPYQVEYVEYYDHHHSRILFYTIEGYAGISGDDFFLEEARILNTLDPQKLAMLREMGQSFPEMVEWVKSHDIQGLRMEWTLEWLAENEAKLYSWEIGLDPAANPFSVLADVVQGSWFEPPIWSGTVEEEVRVVDGLPILWCVEWANIGWRYPFRVWSGNELVSEGIVKAMHIDWGE